MTCPSIVRVARPEDEQEVWRLFLSGHRENGQFSLAPEKAGFFITRALRPDLITPWDTGPRGAIGVIGEVGSLEGAVMIFISSHWYTHDRQLEEYLVYVDPECRRSFHARALINWMKEQSRQVQLPLMSGVISSIRTKGKCELYGRMMPKLGEFFFYRGDHEATALSSAAVA